MATTVVDGIGTLHVNVNACSAAGVSPITITLLTTIPDSVQVGQWINVVAVANNNGQKQITAIDRTANTITYAGTGSGTYSGSSGYAERLYSTVDAWEQGTDNNLVGLDEKRIGEAYTDSVYTLAAADLTFAGATTDATRNRELRAWRGSSTVYQRYDPASWEGVLLSKTVTASFPVGLKISENYFTLNGIGVEIIDGSGGSGASYRGVEVTASNVVLDGVTVLMREGNSTSNPWDAFYHTSGGGTSTTYLEVRNCVAVGSGTANVGCVNGFRSSIAFDRLHSCTAYRVAGATTGRGVNWNGANQQVKNTISLESGFLDFTFQSGTLDHCISSDQSTIGTTGSYQDITATALFIGAPYRDFRVKYGSVGHNNGVTITSFSTDILGNPRTAPWPIGVYAGVYTPSTADPTIITKTVGATGRDYASLDLFEAASRVHPNLVYRNERWVAVCYNDATFSAGAAGPIFEGCLTDARCYREVRAASGHAYVLRLDTGLKITGTASARSGLTGKATVVDVRENYFRMSGFCIENTATGTSDCYSLWCVATRCLFDKLSVKITGGTGGRRDPYYNTGDYTTIRNSIAVGNNNTNGANYGFRSVAFGARVQNCDALRIRRGAAIMYTDDGVAGTRFTNCIAGGGAGTVDTAFAVEPGYQDHNISADSTAAGFGSVQNFVPSDNFYDNTNNDLRLKSTSILIDVGADLSDEFQDDAEGNVREGLWEPGALAGYVAEPPRPYVPLYGTQRRAKCFVIARLDGTVFRLTDHNSPLVFKGQTFSPTHTISPSTRQHASGTTEGSVEGTAYLTSGGITAIDVFAGRYDNAIVYEYDIDWLYPFQGPRLVRYYVIREYEHDSEVVKFQLDSMATLLQATLGRKLSVTCPLQLFKQGDFECNVDRTAFTSYSSLVSTVLDDSLEFESSDLAGNYEDDFFKFGVIQWLTGDNAGLKSVCLEYEDVSGRVKLFGKLPFAVQTSDSFDISAGCDKAVQTCNGKFNNVSRFGGNPFLPGSRKLLQTPIR